MRNPAICELSFSRFFVLQPQPTATVMEESGWVTAVVGTAAQVLEQASASAFEKIVAL
jgi:hypothetical protein